MYKIKSSIVFITFISIFAGLPLSCQDYGFEELANSVIPQKRETATITVASAVDILLVVDNSGSMVGEQLQLGRSFAAFSSVLEEKFGDNYHIAVITTGIESDNCPLCGGAYTQSCINETLENGRFQDRIGTNQGTEFEPDYIFVTDESCRVVTQDNDNCFYQEDGGVGSGIVLDGITGCGYERGLEAIRMALQTNMLASYNDGFLREDATLAIIVISDEDDCGNVDDVNETLPNIMADVCYYAAKGEDPDGNTTDPNGNPYTLTPVQEYYEFLVGLKGEGNVKFAAIVGMEDKDDPGASEIIYEWREEYNMYRPKSACSTPNCNGIEAYCSAKPGTRYIDMAQMFGENGFTDTICQERFDETMAEIGTFVACPERFKLTEPIRDPALANFIVDGESIPKYTCTVAVNNILVGCDPEAANPCAQGECQPSWIYCPPDGSSPSVSCPTRSCDGLNFDNAPGGFIQFCEHYDPCELLEEGQVNIELVYVTATN
jgi:hypothetical protein